MEWNDAALKRKEGHAADLAPYPRVSRGGLHHMPCGVYPSILTKQHKLLSNQMWGHTKPAQ